MRFCAPLAGLLLVGGTFGAAAADVTTGQPVQPAPAYPDLEGTLDLELGDNYVFSSDDPGAEINDLYFKGALGLKLGLTPIFSVNGGLTLEPVRDPDPFRDRTFGDEGLYVDTLNLQADIGRATFLAGKFEPEFGRAWDVAPGVFGTDFAEDYEVAEQIGLSAAYSFGTAGMGTHTLTGAVFYADRSVLSDSIFTERGQRTAADGGAGNTGRLDNFMLSLAGEAMPALPGLSYQLAYRHLSAGAGGLSDEDGFVASLLHETALSNGVTFGLLGEAAYFSGYGGSGDDALYFTAGGSVSRGPWHGELSATLRDFDFAAGGSGNDYLAQISAGYEFESGYDISLGYAMVREADIVSHEVGLRLTKSFGFSTRD
jgi:hypothetical protein